jgi:type I restriction enzyme, S subunit
LPYFLQSADISTPFINTETMVCVSKSDWNRYPKGRVIPGECGGHAFSDSRVS